jgi:ABC-type transport system involved in multi-copper enzyme maturation permease subunit
VGDIPPPVAIDAFGWVLVNLWALYSAVAGLCLLASALCSEQGRAIAIGVSFVVVSFFVNLIASLWSLVSWTDIASVFHYYQPHPLVRGGQAPLLHLAVLLGLAIAANAAALIAFERRDIAGP